jgi:large subunit ribosomal protein L22
MIVKSIAKNVKGSARKARIPARVVLGMKVEQALPVLQFMEKAAAKDVYKVVKSAAANAEHNFKLNAADLVIESIVVDDGFKLKRNKAGSRGGPIFFDRRYCHITVKLSDQKALPAVPASGKEKAEKAKSVKKEVVENEVKAEKPATKKIQQNADTKKKVSKSKSIKK